MGASAVNIRRNAYGQLASRFERWANLREIDRLLQWDRSAIMPHGSVPAKWRKLHA